MIQEITNTRRSSDGPSRSAHSSKRSRKPSSFQAGDGSDTRAEPGPEISRAVGPGRFQPPFVRTGQPVGDGRGIQDRFILRVLGGAVGAEVVADPFRLDP